MERNVIYPAICRKTFRTSCIAVTMGLLLASCANTINYDVKQNTTTEIQSEQPLSAKTTELVNTMLASKAVQAATRGARSVLALAPLNIMNAKPIDGAPLNLALQKQLSASGKFQLSNPESVAQQSVAALRDTTFGEIDNDSATKIGQALGADFILFGNTNDQYQQTATERTVANRIEITLLNVRTGKVVWQGSDTVAASKKPEVYGI